MPENDYTTNIYAVVKERYGDKMTTTPEQFKEKMQDDNYAKNIYAVVKEKYGDKFTKTPEEFKAQFVSTPTDTTPIPTVKLDPIQVQHPDLKPIPKEAADAMMNSFTKMPKDLVDNPIYRNVFYNTFAKKLGLDAAVVKQYGERGIVENLIMDADNRIHNGENNPELLQYVAKLHRSIGNEKQANEAEALSYQMMADAPVGGGSFQDNGSTTDGMSGRRFATTSFGFSGKNGFTLEKNEKGDVIPIANNQPTQNSEYLNNIATAVENIGTAGLKHFVIDPAFHAIDEGQKYREEAKQFAKEGNNLKAAIHEVVGNGLMLVGLVSASTPAGAAGMAAFTGGTEAFPVLEKGLMPVSTFRNWASEQVHKLGPEFKAQADIIDDVITKDVATGLDFMWMAFLHGKGKEAIADVKDAKAYTETMKRGQPSTERMSKMFAKTFKEMTPSELYDFKQKTLERSQERAAKGLTEEESLLDVKNNIAQEMTQLNGMANEIPTTLEHPYKPVQQPEVLKNLEPSQPVVMNGKDGILKINPQGEWQFHSSDGGEPVTVKAKPTKEGEPAQTLTDMGISIPHIMSDWQASAEMSLADFIGETKVDGKDVTVIQGKAGDHVLRKLPSGEYEAMFETRTPENEKQLKKLKLDAINQAREAEGLEPKTRLNENYAKEPEPPEPTPTEDISAKKADIEKRRQEELKQNFKLELSSVKPLSGITTLGNLRDAILQAEKEGALLEDINKLKTAYNNGLKINAKYDAELKALEDNISVTNDKTQTNGKESSQSQSGEKAQENVLVTDNGTELKGSTTLAPTSEPVSPNAGESVVVNGKEVLDITPDATKVPPPDSPIERTDSPSGTGGDVASIKVDNQKSERPNLSRLTPDEMTVEIKKDIPTAVKNSQRTTTRVLEGGKSELSQQEVIELVVARADMNNRMSKLLAEERTLDNKENKTPDEIQRLEDVKTDLSTIDAEILNFEKVAYQTGLDMSRAFAARKLLLDSQYDLLHQERVWQKELDRPPTKAESDALKDKIKRVKELEKEVQDLTIKHEAETKQAVFDAVKAAVEKLNKQKPEGKLTEEQLKAKAERKARKEQLKNEILHDIGKSGLNSLINPEKILNKKVLEYAKLAVEDAANDFRKFAKDMVDAFKDIYPDIKDYLKQAYKEAGGTGEIYKIEVKDDKLKLPQQLIRDLVNEGADTPDKLTEAIKKEIPEGLDVTTEQIEAAWSDYGREVSKTKEQLQQDINSLKKLKRLEQELADAKAGKKNVVNKYVVDPLKNAVSPSNKEGIAERNKTAIKEIEKQIKQEIQNNPAYEGVRESKKIQSIDSQIARVQERINKKQYAPKPKEEPPTSKAIREKELELYKAKEKFKTDIEVAKLNSQSKLQKAGHLLMDIANTSRAIKASGDLSFPGRQGLFLAPAYPRIFARAFRDMITKDAASTKKYDEFMHQLMTDPKYSLIKKSGLELSRLDAKESAYEETSRGQMLYRIEKGVGDLIELSGGNRKYNPISPLSKIFRGSNQAYSGFANRLRVGVFMDGAEALAREGITDPKQLKAWAKIVNASSGRGNIQLGDVTSSVFFSARFQYSRLELLGRFLDPNTSAKVKMLHLKNTVKYALSVAAALEIARLALQNSGVNASVETNPESSDYGLLRVGNSRIDLTAGLAPWIRLTTKLATGKKKDSDTGIITDIDKINESLRFARSKTSPVVGNAISAITGKDFLGNPTTVLDQTKDLLAPAPMTAQLAYEAFDKVEMPEWTALVLLSTFGIGASNYEKPVEQQALTVKKSSGDMKVRQLAGIYLTNDPEKKKAFMQELGRTGVNVENTDWNKVSIDLQQHGISKENADGIKNDMRLEYSRARDMKAIKNEKEIKRLEKVNEKIDELLHPNFIQKNLTPGELPIVQSVLGKDETWEWDAEFGRLFKKAIEDLDLPADTYDKYKNAYDIAKHKKVE